MAVSWHLWLQMLILKVLEVLNVLKDLYSENHWIGMTQALYPMEMETIMTQDDYNEALIEMNFKPAEDLSWVQNFMEMDLYPVQEIVPSTKRLNEEWRRLNGVVTAIGGFINENELFPEEQWLNVFKEAYDLDWIAPMSLEEYNDALIMLNSQPAEDLSWIQGYLDSADLLEDAVPMTAEMLNEEWRRIFCINEVKEKKVEPEFVPQWENLLRYKVG